MPKINIDDVELNMIITEEVKGSQGQLLLAAGTIVNAKHIRVMKTWGVANLVVEGDEDEPALEDIVITDEMLEVAQKAEVPRFKHANMEHDVIQFLWQEKLKRRALASVAGQ